MIKLRSLFLVFFSLLIFAPNVFAVEILAVVSPRNTPDVLSGAHQFLDTNAGHKITLRTTDQFNGLTEEQRQELLNNADIVFLGGVFGDSINVFKPYFKAGSQVNIKRFVAVHSDRSLVKQSRIMNQQMLTGADIDELMKDPPAVEGVDIMQWAVTRLDTFSQHRDWLLTKTFWSDRDTDNMDGLFRQLTKLAGAPITVPLPKLQKPLRVFVDRKYIPTQSLELSDKHIWVAILDYETGGRPGERDLIDQICSQLENDFKDNFKDKSLKCLRVLAKWGQSTLRASQLLAKHKEQIGAVVSLQNFVLGGGEGRSKVNQALATLDVPVIKGLRLTDSTAEEWRLSEEGLRWDSVHYRIAMPELQGISQPLVVAAMSKASIDPRTGVKLALSKPVKNQVTLLAKRVNRWIALQQKQNKNKHIAIIYYNHPPGRHNIGADNLNVPESLLEILQHLKNIGYDTGELPESREALLDILQDRGVNLPEDRGALREMAGKVQNITPEQYQKWFDQLPNVIRDEMENGPLGYLHIMLQTAVKFENPDIAQRLVRRVVEDLKHAMEGTNHKSRDRVMDLLKQLEALYKTPSNGPSNIDWIAAQEIVDAIVASGVEGIRGWGKAPGKVMVHEGNLLIPGIKFGNVFVGPQPPRGWELNEEILHANLSFPPTHQYLAFYQWLRNDFSADALVHLGRHSTYEFLPRHRVGMGDVDYPIALIDDLPSVYPYIVDGVGEGIQAKRRGLAVMVDHLTPPLESTELYDRLLQLRQLVESYEAAPEAAGAMRHRAIVAIKALVDDLKLSDELTESMAGELEVRGVKAYDEVDDELLVHEVGHYLTKLQEDFMPLGLHSFGQDWSPKAVETMLDSMSKGFSEEESISERPTWKVELSASPKAEITALEHGLNGRYIKPGKGNDPIRTPEVLPTGRNFFALDGGLIPSRLGYQVGVDLATKARAKTSSDESDAVVLWASDVVRDEGAMIAFGFDMLGIKPVWSSRGIVKSLERVDIPSLSENGKQRVRRDIMFTASGLFRDLYGSHIVWLEQAVLMALDASSNKIRKDYPALSLALNAALDPLGKKQNPGSDPLSTNHVAKRWVDDARLALRQGRSAEYAGVTATYRVFGDAPGTYGAGVNRLVERSGSWEDRSEIADVYIRRMGHAYGANVQGEPQQDVFQQRLKTVGNTYLGRSSNLYGLLDNNDTFDYLGGLSLAVEITKGSVPNNFILSHPDSTNISIEPLSLALLSELRGRFLNPQWLEPLMDEGYAGARTMGSEFFEYLWGWQVTNPDVVKSWVWDEVKAVYIDDSHGIGLDKFLEKNHNVHVKSNMLAVMLVAAQKGFWDADQATLEQISQLFADLITENGLPGSGHTTPNSPIFGFIKDYVSEQSYQQVQDILKEAKIETVVEKAPSTITEINDVMEQKTEPKPEGKATSEEQQKQQDEQETASSDIDYRWLLALLIFLIIVGIVRGSRAPKAAQKSNQKSSPQQSSVKTNQK